MPLRPDVALPAVQEALKPLWTYAGATSLAMGARSSYEEEPGIRFNAKEHMLQICWTVPGDEDFRQVMEEACMGLNDIAASGAPIEVSFYDAEFDDDEGEEPEGESRDDFMMCFVGPTPAAILQVQRDMLVQDVVHLMERHFEANELEPVCRPLTSCSPTVLMHWSTPCNWASHPKGSVAAVVWPWWRPKAAPPALRSGLGACLLSVCAVRRHPAVDRLHQWSVVFR